MVSKYLLYWYIWWEVGDSSLFECIVRSFQTKKNVVIQYDFEKVRISIYAYSCLKPNYDCHNDFEKVRINIL